MHRLRKTFAPLLDVFEKGEGPYVYKPSHRKILMAVGVLFLFLSIVGLYFGLASGIGGAVIPVLIFFVVSVVCLVVGALGNERAVATIWGSR